MSILIIDYGLCNLDSIKRAIEECGGDSFISSESTQAASADKLIIPGVGNFKDAMMRMDTSGWVDSIRHEVINNRIPILGICLGMQLLSTYGDEGGGCNGLALIPGKVIKLAPNIPLERIPHVGWNQVEQVANSPLFENIANCKDFYFVHSYHFVPESAASIIGVTPYCGKFASVIQKDHIYGTQFHPEKSQRSGFQMLKNFINL